MSTRPYPSYKDSGVKWFASIPASWEALKLKYVATVQPSNVDKKSEDGELPVKLCNYVDVYYHDRITADMDFMLATATEAEKRKFQLRAGDVCVTKDSEEWSDIAVPACVAEDVPDLLCGYHLALVRPRVGHTHGQFLAWAFSARGVNDQFRVEANGITRFALGQDALCNALFPVPPLDEQQAIASFLDRETVKIDALVKKMERLVELLQEQRTARISHAVTQGLNPNAPMKDSGIPWLGHIPKHWSCYPLRRFIRSMCDGPFGSDMKSSHYGDSGVRLIRLQNIERGYFDDTDKAFIPESHFLSLPGHDVLSGDLLVAGLGDDNHPVGRACVLPDHIETAMVKADCFRVRLDQSRLVHTFAMNFLCSSVARAGVSDQTRGATRARMNLSGLTNLCVPVPPITEQIVISDFISAQTTKLDALMAKVRTAIDRLQEYRTALISAAVTGQIDVRSVSTL